MQNVQNKTLPDNDQYDCCQPLFDDAQSPQITPTNTKQEANIITNHLKRAIKESVAVQKEFVNNMRSQDSLAKIETKIKKSEEQKALTQSILYNEPINKHEKTYIPPPNNSNNLSEEENSVLTQLHESANCSCDLKFSNLKSNFIKYTEVEIPFLIQQVEDAMYLTQGVIISLRYNFYQRGVKTTVLEQVNDNPSLGTSTYQIEGVKPNEMSHFNVGIDNPVINFKDSKNLYHEYQEKNGVGKLMEAQNSESIKSKIQGNYTTDNKNYKKLAKMENDCALVEGSLCIWKADEKSKLFPYKEQSFSMQLPYQPTKEGRMQMSITRDQKVVSLLYFNRYLHQFTSNCDMNYQTNQSHFKILSWKLDHDYSFQKPQDYQILCQNINKFYLKKKRFQVHSSRFFSGCKYFMLKFSEKQKEITEDVVKYVILDSITGEIIIEIDQNQTLETYNHREKLIVINTIDIIVKDLPIQSNQSITKLKYEQNEEYSNEIAIFYGGEIMKFHQTKREKKINEDPLGFSYVTISIDKLKERKEGDSKLNLMNRLKDIKTILKSHCHNLKKEDDNVFCIQTCLSYKDQWYKDVQIRPNKQFNFIYLSIIPKGNHQNKKLSIYSTDAKKILESKYENGTQKRDEKHMALEEKILNKDQIFHHCRNAHIKEDCMYILQSQIDGFLGYSVCVLSNGEVQTESIKIDISETNISKLDITGYPQTVDPNTFERDQKFIPCNKIMQIVQISTIDFKLSLTTKLPLTFSRKGEEFCYIYKSSLNFLQLSASFPIICRNTGLHQLLIVNIMERNNPKEYILQLKDNEFFLTFVTFNSYNDIGFYPQFIRIECCTNFLFLTKEENKVKMNLLLVDPYYDEIQIVLFKSSHIIPVNDFNEEDIIIKSIICPTKKHAQEQQFQIYVITQYEATINRSMFFEDIEKLDGTNDKCLKNDKTSNFFDGESDNDAKRSLENVEMLVDKKNFIYYMTKTQGVCTIFEIDPHESQLRYHMKIAEVKAENCLAFSIVGKKFYVMDELNTIHVLSRMNNSRELNFNYELNIKENSRHEIVFKDFKMNIMNDNYYIQGSQIFYLYKDVPYDDGIMETESLIEHDEEEAYETKQTQRGPILFKGSSLFICTHKIDQFKNVLSIYMLPDSQQVTIINDFQNSVDLSTFIDNGNILLKSKNRFMIFNALGIFQNEVQFDQAKDLNEAENITLDQWKIKHRLKNFLSKIKKIEEKENKYFVMGSELIDNKSKMELVQISYSNQLFLFFNRILKEFNVYQMQDTSDYEFPVKTQFMRQALMMLNEDIKQRFKFQHLYRIEFEKSQIYKNVLDEEMQKDEPIGQPINDLIKVNLHNNASVTMSYVFKDIHNASEDKEMFNIIVDIFNKDQNQQQISFVKKFEIDTGLIDLVKMKLQQQIQNLIDKQALIKQRQIKLPHAQQDFTEIERIEQQIMFYKHKINNIISQKVYDNIIIVWCGSYLLYSFYSYGDPKNIEIDDFKQIDITFSDLTEIVRVLDTAYPNIYQIIAKDHEINVFIIITWDFKKNMEVHQSQSLMTNINKEFSIRVFKGMVHKMNYFMDNVLVTDLSSNTPYIYIPTQKEDDDIKISKQNNVGLNYFDNQKKIFKVNQIFLDTEQPSVINFGISRMDLVFWENMERKRHSPQLFEKNVCLHKFSKFYGGSSLFHYFARDCDLIKVIHDKYMMAKNHQKLDPLVEKLPLNAMCPDIETHSALYHCIEMENLKSFEYIIELISDFPGICITNQMIRFIPLMLNKPDSQSFMNFFSKISFKSLSMENKLMISWDQDQDQEFVFLSNTSIITKQLIQKEMVKRGMIDDIKKMEKTNSSQQIDRYIKKISQFDLLKKTYKICNEASKNEEKKRELKQKLQKISEQFEGYENELEKQRNKIKSTEIKPDNIDFYTLNQNTIVQKHTGANEIEEGESRVSIEALEFDWVFKDNNAENLINLLSNLKNFQVLTTKPIKLFVDFMWSQYQKEIIKWIFIPYCIYLITFIYLTTSVLNHIIERKYGDITEIPESEQYQYHELCIEGASLTSICSIFFMFFAGQEISAILDSSVQDYYTDFWNWIDTTTLVLNSVFLMIITCCQVSEQIFINEFAIRRLGAFACFFMCIKLFYWMRLFEPLAKYVSLITNTIIDCMWFMSLVLIIIVSFAIFFYVINLNMLDQSFGEDTYVPSYTYQNPLLDAFLEVYFICIGMFDVTLYGRGIDEYYVWAMFLLGTFINLIVFMNMLIAIMSKTFNDVMDNEQQSSLSEKIFIIKDHIWIIDYNKLFENKKYLIRVHQITSECNESYGISDYLNTLQTNFNRKFDHLHNTMNQKVLVQDNTSRSFYKIQQESKNGIKQILSYVNSQQNLHKNKVEDQYDLESQTTYSRFNYIRRKTEIKERKDKNIIPIDELLNTDKYDKKPKNSFSRDSEDEELISLKQDLQNKEVKENLHRPQMIRSQTIQEQKIKPQINNQLSQSMDSIKSEEEKDSVEISSQEMIIQEQQQIKIRSKSQEKPNTSKSSRSQKNSLKKSVKKVIKYNKLVKDIAEGYNENTQTKKTDSNLKQIKDMLKNYDIQKKTNIQESKAKKIQDVGKRYNMFKDLSQQIQPRNTIKKIIQGQFRSQSQLDTTMLNQNQSTDIIINPDNELISPSLVKKHESEAQNLNMNQLSNDYYPPRQVYNDEISNNKSDSERKKRQQMDIDQNRAQKTPQMKSSLYDRLNEDVTLYDQDFSQSLSSSIEKKRKKDSLMSKINKNLFNDFNKIAGKGQYTYSTKGQIENKKTKK